MGDAVLFHQDEATAGQCCVPRGNSLVPLTPQPELEC